MRAVLIGWLMLAFAPAAMASDITGNWTFIANVEAPCELTGVAQLSATEDPQRYGCELTARQVCGDSIRFTVRQSCSAVRTGEQLSIQSNIEEFIEGEPTPFYFPDNFALTINSDSRMSGALVSSSTYRAVFIRSIEGVS